MHFVGVLIVLMLWAIGLFILYWVIRLAVSAGIRDSRKPPRAGLFNFDPERDDKPLVPPPAAGPGQPNE